MRAGCCSRVYRQGFPAARHSSAITVLPSATEKDLHQQLIHSVSAMCSLSKTAFPPLSYKHTQIFWAGNATQKPPAPSKSQLTIFQYPLPLFLLSLSPVSVSLQCSKKLQSIKSSEMRDPNVSSSYMPW